MAKQCAINVDLADVFEEPGRKGFLHTLAWGDNVELVETTSSHVRIKTVKFETQSDGSILPVKVEAFITPPNSAGISPADVVVSSNKNRVLSAGKNQPGGSTVSRKIAVVFGWAVILTAWSSCFAAESSKTIRVLYDNYVFDQACGSDWGFACLVSGTEKTILFDTGAKGDLLLANFEKMKLRPADVKLVVISHNHGDHTGGLLPFLAKNEHVGVYPPAATPESFVKEAKAHAASVSVVTKPVEICKGVFVVGPLGDKIIEQALVVDTKKGLVIITGCSHPGVVTIAKKAKEHLGPDIFMVLGGTHLLNHSDKDLQRVVDDLKGLGVQKVGATHCSGEKAISKMKSAFGDGFVTMGVGRVIEVGE